MAWIIGWDLVLEYGISVAAVAVGWGANLNSFLDAAFGVADPEAIATSPEDGGTFNLPAVVDRPGRHLPAGPGGQRDAPGSTLVMVVVKLAVLMFFIVVGVTVLQRRQPRGRSPPTASTGWSARPSIIFFAYIGFDAVSTGSEEASGPAATCPSPSSARC